jgi:hypothetical protein
MSGGDRACAVSDAARPTSAPCLTLGSEDDTSCAPA